MFRVDGGDRTHIIPDSQSGALPLELQPPFEHLRLKRLFERTRRAGIEPAATGFGDQDPAIGTDGVKRARIARMRREGFEPP